MLLCRGFLQGMVENITRRLVTRERVQRGQGHGGSALQRQAGRGGGAVPACRAALSTDAALREG